ncbi:hypothetical protein GM415_06290 [Pseudodesulfovibrio cashew]|uniref:Lipoprotein n=1 Tax=Pseudodesulfovibrio cashew TaxID=2678688 RepID=A0A6I6JGV5_9BACT|nr:hypothetical protein [Pseudodesulfovibrio cashew]QGY39743.1 hypothetical protein GM415_06290 [Pseudodesulfovibrio cashew]
MRIRYLLPVALVLLALAFSGCLRENAIKLNYALGPTLTPCSGEVVIFKFADKRKMSRLGSDSDGTPITALSDVADWVGWALFDELRAAGCEVKYRTSTVTPGETPLVTGEVLEATLNQTGTTTYAGKVVVRVTVTKPGQPAHTEKFTSEVEDVAVPGYGTPSDIMAEVLRGLMAEAVPTICANL